MNPIEKAYKAWRATVKPSDWVIRMRLMSALRGDALYRAPPLTQLIDPDKKPRKYAGTGRRKRTISAEQRESYRRGALKMWKRRKAQA